MRQHRYEYFHPQEQYLVELIKPQLCAMLSSRGLQVRQFDSIELAHGKLTRDSFLQLRL